MAISLTTEQLRFTPPTLDKSDVAALLDEVYGLSGETQPLPGERDQNFRVTADDTRYILKIASPDESDAAIDLQVSALEHLRQHDPALPVPLQIPAMDGELTAQWRRGRGTVYRTRLLTYIPGVPLLDFDPPGADIIAKIGNLQARLCRAFQGFEHPAARAFMPWDVMNEVVSSRELLARYVPDNLKDACESFVEHFESRVLPELRACPAQVIHNDLHAGNVICDPGQPGLLTGVIDFGDLTERPLVVDLASTLASILERERDAIPAACALVDGFEQVMPVPPDQRRLLLDVVRARAVLSVQLLGFRGEHVAGADYARKVELPLALAGLGNILAIDRNAFDTALARDRQ